MFNVMDFNDSLFHVLIAIGAGRGNVSDYRDDWELVHFCT